MYKNIITISQQFFIQDIITRRQWCRKILYNTSIYGKYFLNEFNEFNRRRLQTKKYRNRQQNHQTPNSKYFLIITILIIQWDTAGQERFRTITTSYYKGAQGIVIVYDVTDVASFEHVKSWMNDIDKFAKEGVFKILVGNKCDLVDKRQVPKEKGKQLADSYGIPFIETSAKNNENIEKLFIDSTKAFIDKQLRIGNTGFTQKSGPSTSSAVDLSSQKIENIKKKKCC